MRRVFLGWKKPCLQSSAEYLIKCSSSRDCINLQEIIAVLPGSRAGRRLLEILVILAEGEKRPLIPPRIITVGSLPEVVIPPHRPLASTAQRLVCWIGSLQAACGDGLNSLVSSPPPKEDFAGWLQLAHKFDSLWTDDLAPAALTFEEVAARCSNLPDFFDEERWLALDKIHSAYLRRLAEIGLADREWQRRQAIRRGELECDKNIVLIAAADLNQSTRSLLSVLNAEVISLVHAPAEAEQFFDDFGCLNVSKWLEKRIDLTDGQIHAVQNSEAQAKKVIDLLHSCEGQYSAEEITIGSGDENLWPFIVQHLEEAGLPARKATGRPVTVSTPFTFLEAAGAFVESKSFADFASLVRHIDVQKWLLNHLKETGASLPQEGLLGALDQYQTEHLQARLGDSLPGGDKTSARVGSIFSALKDLLGPLSETPRPLPEWAASIAACLARLYGAGLCSRLKHEERTIIEACEILREGLIQISELDANSAPSVTPAGAVGVLAMLCRQRNLDPDPVDGAIELLGWLELQLDDAPVLIVAGVNEGFIPQSVTSDSFLPNAMRSYLGLFDNDRRLARDAYSLTAMLQSRSVLHLIAGRKDVENNPLLPSRLLYAADDRTLIRRVKCFHQAPAEEFAMSDWAATAQSSSPLALPPPLIKPLKAVEAMSVTSFGTYLQCPYLFYLKHVLKLQAVDDSSLELDGLAFGLLAHEALKDFAGSDLKNSAEPDAICEHLHKTLDKAAEQRFGQNVLPAVLLQIEQLRTRLAAFAAWQAQRRSAGWEIMFSELLFDRAHNWLELGDGKMPIEGRIDRVDFNPAAGTWAILDYKFGEKPQTAEEVHRLRKKWISLQLPLYHYLFSKKHPGASIQLGLVCVSAEPQVQAAAAEWTENELEDAHQTALEVARAVRSQKFAPAAVGSRPPEEYKVIYGTDQLAPINESLSED